MNDISKLLKENLVKLPGGIARWLSKVFRVFFVLCFVSLIAMLVSTEHPFSAMDNFGYNSWFFFFFLYLLISIIYTVLYFSGRSIVLWLSRKIIKAENAEGGDDGPANP